MAIDLGTLGSNNQLTLNLDKGFTLDLTKQGESLKNITFAGGWDVSRCQPPFDLDLSAFFYINDKITNGNQILFFNNPKVEGGYLPKDNRDGSGSGDDETISFNLEKVPSNVNRIRLFFNIYDAKAQNKTFAGVQNAYVRILNDDNNKSEEVKFNLTQDYSMFNTVLVGDLVRNSNGWELQTIGEGLIGDLNDVLQKYANL